MTRRSDRYNPATAPSRFQRKVIAQSNECWLWSGGTHPNGYGYFDGGYAHRWAYENAVGEIPPGLEIDHLCRTRNCVNPSHLELVTHAENQRRRKGFKTGPYNVGTHCKSGHERSPENTRIRPSDGARECIPCRRAAVARYRQKRLAV